MPAVLQKHIVSRCFVAPAQLAVVTKHFLSGSLLGLPNFVIALTGRVLEACVGWCGSGHRVWSGVESGLHGFQ